MPDILKKYVCLNPFTYLDIQPTGQWVCCPSWCPTNLREKQSDNLGFDEDIKKNWLGKKAKLIRKSVTDGSYSHCDHNVCPSLSMLINTGEKPDIFITKEEFDNTYNLETFNDMPKHVLFGFDRSCNLKCPSCRDTIIPNDDVESEAHKIKEFVITSIEDNFSNSMETILITGSGDPIYSKIFRDYLINFDKSKYPNLKNIHLISNGVLLTPEMWNKLKAKDYIGSIEISIDAATKETYENVTRLNGKWDALMTNISYLSTVKTIKHITFSMVVSQNNYKEMKRFYDLIQDIFKFSTLPYMIAYRQIVHWNTGSYSIFDIKQLSIFDQTHPLHQDFLKELKKIQKLPRVNHNFHHLI